MEDRIYSIFNRQPKKLFNYKQLAAELKITDTQGRNLIINCLQLLKRKEKIEEIERGKFSFKIPKGNTVEAILAILPTGKGAISPTDFGEEIIIPKKKINRALHGDTVSALVYRKNKELHAEIIEVLKRGEREYVGVLEKHKDFGFVLCKKGSMYTDLFVSAENIKHYKEGEKVVAVFKDWPKNSDSPTGTIIKSLGQSGETNTEIHAILHDYGLPYDFPKAIESVAAQISTEISSAEIKKRKDFRKTLTFTIDPITAKDFDDALSFKQLETDVFEIGIHIADVSHYVQPNTALDEEAFNRATSVYLVDRVVPMLPEVLSNGLCSLRPQEEKYTFSAVFKMNSKGAVLDEWFGKTIINSDHRFSYEEVQHLLETQQTQVTDNVSLNGKAYEVPPSVFESIQHLDGIAKKLRSHRMKKGAISFDRVEVNFHLNEANHPEGVYFKTSKDAHKLIEEFMLLANRKVAEFIGKRKAPLPFVYRIHDDPDEEKLLKLKSTISQFGYQLEINSKNISGALNQLLLDCNGKKEQNLIDTMTLRCMSKAEYSTKNIGHYGLAFNHYSHFTSPIRRYPDVMVHRLLQHYLEGGTAVKEDLLEEACVHCSQREQLATKAERDSIKFMQVLYMEDKVGMVFDGVISGVTDRGMYVEINDNKCEGMIRIMDIKGDYYNFDERNLALVGERKKKVFQLGDAIKIKVKKANVIKRFLDFEPV